MASRILLVAGIAQVWGSIWGFLYPKIFCTFWTDKLNRLVAPFPILQSINLVCGVIIIVCESGILSDDSLITRSILLRTQLYAAFSVFAFINYQTTDVSVLLIIGIAILVWAYIDGEGVRPPPKENAVSAFESKV